MATNKKKKEGTSKSFSVSLKDLTTAFKVLNKILPDILRELNYVEKPKEKKKKSSKKKPKTKKK
jgi:hypothetical protein